MPVNISRSLQVSLDSQQSNHSFASDNTRKISLWRVKIPTKPANVSKHYFSWMAFGGDAKWSFHLLPCWHCFSCWLETFWRFSWYTMLARVAGMRRLKGKKVRNIIRMSCVNASIYNDWAIIHNISKNKSKSYFRRFLKLQRRDRSPKPLKNLV